ncbi:MAG: hypothetical protein KDE21_06590 [Novosphingobium sp.]|nr:hypothetical protein [Novosphingobium sp.]
MHFARFLLPLAPMLLAACSERPTQQSDEAATSGYVIGLGEIMGLNQMRHAKLWFAGQADNWPLAAYELEELREGFSDAMRYHAHHKSVPRPLTEMIPEYMDVPLANLDRVVASRDKAGFIKAYDALTAGCNGCHEEADFGYNVITRPTAPPYSNQAFEPAGPDGTR